MRNIGLIPIVTLNHFTLPLWVLSPPDTIAKNIVQRILPSPLRDAPVGKPSSTDSYGALLEDGKTMQQLRNLSNLLKG